MSHHIREKQKNKAINKKGSNFFLYKNIYEQKKLGRK